MSKVNNKGVRATAIDIVQASIMLTFDFKIVFAGRDMYLIQSFVDSQKESLPHKKLGPFLFPIFWMAEKWCGGHWKTFVTFSKGSFPNVTFKPI